MELLRDLPDESVDLILTDLPYGITQNKWDTVLNLDKLWREYKRIRKPAAPCVLFAAMPFTATLVISNKKEFKYIWVWYKHYCRGFLNEKKQPLRTTEHIAVFYHGQCTYNPQMTKGPLRSKGNSAKQRGCYGKYEAIKTVNDIYYPKDILDFAGVPINELKHPTQKPVPLLEYLIRTYTNEGDLVLDSCMGVGSTGVACVNTCRNFIGMEINEEYLKTAKERIFEAGGDISE